MIIVDNPAHRAHDGGLEMHRGGLSLRRDVVPDSIHGPGGYAVAEVGRNVAVVLSGRD